MRAEATGSSQGSRICIQLLQNWAGRDARLQSQSHLSRCCPAIETQRIIRTLILANERPPHVPRIHRVSRKAAGDKVETSLPRVARIREFVRSRSDISLP